jgi:phosphoribosylanthranilate isomerase
MTGGIRLKVCGLTSLADAEFADRLGADYLGFILYPGSPRHISLEKFHAIQGRLPEQKKVAVCVSPTAGELREFKMAGADFIQVHFPLNTPADEVSAWSEVAGPRKLWLAPRLPPETDLPDPILALADVFLLDTFSPGKFGGTGLPGDWTKFARHQGSHPRKSWILSGGLNPENITEALKQSGARWVDVNSGVESAPGRKDRAKVEAFVGRLRAWPGH